MNRRNKGSSDSFKRIFCSAGKIYLNFNKLVKISLDIEMVFNILREPKTRNEAMWTSCV